MYEQLWITGIGPKKQEHIDIGFKKKTYRASLLFMPFYIF